ncbi:MAG: imidazole glycerol phosphate synthase subunit HisH [Paracoccaceae bacterium]|jgi:glutamine amidotransferase
MRTVLVDYGSGNLHSAHKAFERMSQEQNAGDVIVSSRPEDVAGADRIVLPGDGAFPACRQALSDHQGLFEAILEAVTIQARPFMGICVGMQMLASWGREYQDTAGFNWIEGEVIKIVPNDKSLKVPHMGWNDLILDERAARHPVFSGLRTGDHAYFVHSYQFNATNPAHRLAQVDYGGPVTAIVGRDTMIGTQFHPEKSQALGLSLISNFLTWHP